jgi:hypothetical protein
MNIYDHTEILAWLDKHTLSHDVINPKHIWPDGSTIYRVPTNVEARTHLSKAIAESYENQECLLWVRLTGVWPSCENEFLFNLLRRQLGEERPIYEAPFHVFGVNEKDFFESFTSLCLYYMWDFEIISQTCDVSIYVNHDDLITAYGLLPDRVQEMNACFDYCKYEKFTGWKVVEPDQK